ncbi:MAG TPA: LysE family translocator [Streptosporangiaceae bacterium]|jgi:threonine/homoserine/homoserine lactone efflux protein|nr:LysE family translocator [Streptosporangiaceae bacterium]
MALDPVFTFWAICLLLIAVPGADWAFITSAGLRGRSVVPAVSGLVLGYTGLTAVVAIGVGALVARSPALLTALTVAGGAYLIWRGAATLRTAPPELIPSGLATAGSGPAFTGPTVARGVGVSGLNPKGLLLFLALLPQFADRHGSWPMPAQLGLLGVVFTVTCGTFYLGLGSVVRKILLPRPWTARAVTRVSGAAMIVIGALLLAERFLATGTN